MTMQQQNMETVGLGQLKMSEHPAQVFAVSNIGTSIAVMIYDPQRKFGGIAHIVLPDSSVASSTSPPGTPPMPAKFADEAIPELLKAYVGRGGNAQNSIIRIVGGAQLFNFGGGSGNLLNVGARNAATIQSALSKQGLTVAHADVGGNKAKTIRFVVATGQILIQPIGGKEYAI